MKLLIQKVDHLIKEVVSTQRHQTKRVRQSISLGGLSSRELTKANL